jgi:hypothetical protein
MAEDRDRQRRNKRQNDRNAPWAKSTKTSTGSEHDRSGRHGLARSRSYGGAARTTARRWGDRFGSS